MGTFETTTLEAPQDASLIYESRMDMVRTTSSKLGFGVEIPKSELSFEATGSHRNRKLRAIALVTGFLALGGGMASLKRADAAIPIAPSHRYSCPEDFINPRYEPLRANMFNKQPEYAQGGSVDLGIAYDNTRYNLEGNPVELTTDCVGASSKQFQVANIGPAVAENPIFSFSAKDDPQGNLLNPHNLAGIEIQKVTSTDGVSFTVPDSNENTLPDCTISVDKSSVYCSLGKVLGHSQERILRVYYISKNPVIAQDFEASIQSSTPEIDPTDNVKHYQEDIYPEKLSVATISDQPKFRNSPAHRLNAKCFTRPIEITAPLSRPLYNGRVVADIGYSATKDFARERHVRIIKRFNVLKSSTKGGVLIPVKVCNVPKQRFVEAIFNVFAINAMDPAPFYAKAHLSASRKRGKKSIPTWHFERTLG